MVFCGQCGYQLAPGDTICPRCGAKTDAELIDFDPGVNSQTEVSRALVEQIPTQSVKPPRSTRLEQTPTQSANPPNYTRPASWPNQQEPAGPLILGPVAPNTQFANEPTAMMNAQTYAAPQPAYPTYGAYPQQIGATGLGYNPAYQAGQSAVVAHIVEASQRGKTVSLLLILFGLLLLIAAVVVFLLSQQGIIFA